MPHDPGIPAAILAEKLLISAALVDEEAVDIAGLPPEAFYDDTHARIWRAILRARGDGERIDAAATALEAGVEPTVMAEIMDQVGSPLAADRYAEEIRRAWLLRRALNEVARAYQRLSRAETDPVEALLDLGRIAHEWAAERGGAPRPFEEASRAMAERLVGERPMEPVLTVALSATGPELMSVAPGELHLLAAATGMGKSAMALQIARAMAWRWPVLVYTLEMSAEEYAARLLVQLGLVTPRQARYGGAPKEALERFDEVWKEKMGRSSIYIQDQALSQESLLLDIRRQVRQLGVKGVVVDYLGLVELPSQALKEKRYRALEDLTTALKRLAAELRIVIIAVHQLNRLAEVEKSGLHLWGDSYGMVRPADGAYLLIRKRGENKATWRKEKVRSGPTGEVELLFDPEKLQFV